MTLAPRHLLLLTHAYRCLHCRSAGGRQRRTTGPSSLQASRHCASPPQPNTLVAAALSLPARSPPPKWEARPCRVSSASRWCCRHRLRLGRQHGGRRFGRGCVPLKPCVPQAPPAQQRDPWQLVQQAAGSACRRRRQLRRQMTRMRAATASPPQTCCSLEASQRWPAQRSLQRSSGSSHQLWTM